RVRRGERAMALRRDRLGGVQAGDCRQRPVQSRAHADAAPGPRGGCLGTRGGAGLCGETPEAESGKASAPGRRGAGMTAKHGPLGEVFIRTRNGMAHRHAGSVHAVDAKMALQNARDVYTRRGEGLSIWVVPSAAITASDPAEQDMLFEPTASKIYRHPSFYEVPEDVGHM